MCGIIACVSLNSTSQCNSDQTTNPDSHSYVNGCVSNYSHTGGHKLAQQLQKGLEKIKHRGPDGCGVWISPLARVGLGHCRLSTNDLSPSVAQPLHSDCGEIHAVVNGETYDSDRLREECASIHGYKFHGTSDSELVLALYKIHGAPGFFEHLRGEFSFVLYDDRGGRRRVIAGRDRFGIRPLVYTTVNGRLLLAAEAKAFLAWIGSPSGMSEALWTVAGWEMIGRCSKTFLS